MADFDEYEVVGFASPTPAPKKFGIADVRAKAQEFGIDPDFAEALIIQESGGRADVRNSPKGAAGIAQVMPATFRAMMGKDADIRDPAANLEAGLRYMKYGAEKLGIDSTNLDGDSAKLLAAGYHQGYDRASLKKGIIDNTNDGLIETPKYAQTIADRREKIRSSRPQEFDDYEVIGFAEPKPQQQATKTEKPARYMHYVDFAEQARKSGIPEGKIDSEWRRLYEGMEAPIVPKRGLLEAAWDTNSAFATGAVGMVKSLSDVAGAQNPVSEFLGDSLEGIKRNRSAQARAQDEIDAAEADAVKTGSWLDRAGVAAKQALNRPVETIAEGAGSVLPMMVGGALGLGGKGIVALSGAAGVGAVKGQIDETVKNTKDADLMTDPAYKALRESGVSEANAKATIADRMQSYIENPGKIAAGGVIGALVGKLGAVEGAIANMSKQRAAAELEKQASQGIIKGFAKGAGREMATEAPQEFAENVLGNLGAASGGATIPWDQGAVEGATKAAIMSAVPGGAAGVVSGVQARGQLDAKTALDQAKAREAAEKLNTQTSVGLQTIQSAQSVDEIISAAVVATEPVKSPTLALPAPGSQADSGVLVDDGGQLRPQTLEEQAQSRAARVRAERDAYERQQLGPTDDVLRAQSVRNSPVSRETLSSGEEDAGNRPGVPAGIGDTGRAGPTASGLAGAGTGIEGIGRPANDNQPTVAPVPGIARGDVSGVVSEEVRQSSDSEDAVYPSGMAALQARLKSGRVKTHEPVQLADGFRLVPKGTGQIARLMMGDLARDMAKPEPRDRSPKDTLRAHIRKIGGVTPQSLRTALGLKKTARERKSYIGYANTKGQSLDALVSSGSLDDYLPFDLRQNDNDAPDVAGDKEARATEYIADRIAEGGDTKPYNPIPDDEPQGQAEPWADVQKRLARIARKLAKASARDARLKDNAAQAERDTAIREAIADVRAAEAELKALQDAGVDVSEETADDAGFFDLNKVARARAENELEQLAEREAIQAEGELTEEATNEDDIPFPDYRATQSETGSAGGARARTGQADDTRGTRGSESGSREDVGGAQSVQKEVSAANNGNSGGSSDVNPKPLYAYLPVKNAAEIIAWARSQGFKQTLSASDLHVTVAYSKSPIDGKSVGNAADEVRAKGGKRTVTPLGDEGAVVLKFDSPALQSRWKAYRDAGASWDYESYQPHVTITYDGAGVDLSKIKPFDGDIQLGKELQEPLDEDFSVKETPVKKDNSSETPSQQGSSGIDQSGEAKTGQSDQELTLAAQTEADLRARAEAAEAEAAKERKAREKAEADAKAARERAEIAQRSVAAADTFQLTSSAQENRKAAEDNLSGQGDIFAAPPASAPKAADGGPGKKPDQRIADFGEKIGGARKDTWASFREQITQVPDTEIGNYPLSKIWPQPDYQALLNGGMDSWTVAFIRAARDEIPPKPRVKYKLKRWSETVRELRGMTSFLMADAIDAKAIKDAISQRDSMQNLRGRIDLYQLVGHGKSLEGIRVQRGEYTMYNRVVYNPPKVIWTVEKDSSATAFGNWPRTLVSADTREAVLNAFKKKFDTLDIAQASSKDISFDIFTDRTKPGYWIGKKIGRNIMPLAGPFESIKEARDHKAANQSALVAKLEKLKEVPNERRDTNEPRVGEDMRSGQDVTPDQFAETFGFRGVEFGNWVEQDRRQQDLNDAFDALMDMAAILGIPPKAISLNGELGLAFGARGSGGTRSAAAHYEAGKAVINLTKRRGAGSLGHEWWHALDNYFARIQTGIGGMMTDDSTVSMASRNAPFEQAGGVRKEMVEAFGAVMREIRLTAMKARSSKLDASRTKAYWTTSPEMSARAFESFLISKLQDQGASNDYLANVVDPETWKAAESLGFELASSYPYPTAGEIPAIRSAFEHFFDVIQSRKTDKGVALFSRGDGPTPLADVWMELAKSDDLFDAQRAPDSEKDITALAARFLPDVKLVPQTVSETGDYKAQWQAKIGTQTIASITQYRDGKVELDVLFTGVGNAGKRLYSIAGAYAKNNGLEFSGDRNGMTPIGKVRRMENMAALALKYGTTDFMSPHADQLADFRKFGLEWTPGDTRGNIDAMLEASANLTRIVAPEIEALTYDPRREQFVVSNLEAIAAGDQAFFKTLGRVDGDVFTNGDFDALASRASERRLSEGLSRAIGSKGLAQIPAGRSTLKRAVVSLTSLQESSAGVAQGGGIGGSLLAQFEGGSGKPLAQALNGIVYKQGPATAGLSLSAVEGALKLMGLQDPGAKKINVVQSVADLPEALRRQIAARTDGVVRGLYDPETDEVFLVADHLKNTTTVLFVAMHEIRHRGLRALFGSGITPILNQIHLTNKNVRAAVTKMQKKALANGRPMDRLVAVEEVLADMVLVGDMQRLKGWDRLVQFIKEKITQFAAKLGLEGFVFTDVMVEQLVAAAQVEGAKDGLLVFGDREADTFLLSSETSKGATGDTITVDGKDRPTTNSNGMPIHPTEEGVRNFYAWFGDSKVVDDQGRPITIDGLYVKHDKSIVLPKMQEWIDRAFMDGARSKKGESPSWFDNGITLKLSEDELTDRGIRGWERRYGDPELERVVHFAARQAFLAGAEGYSKPSLKIGKRLGAPPPSGFSFNSRDNEPEPGVSVLGIVDANSSEFTENTDQFSAMFLRDRDEHYVAGFENTRKIGADGEDLLMGVVDLGPLGNQIKSATGNTGAFSADPDIRFSRGLFDESVSEPVAPKVTKSWLDSRKDGVRAVALGGFTRRQITEMYGKDAPELAAYNQAAADMDARRSSLAEDAGAVLEAWRKLKDADDLADVMHAATKAQFDPDTGTVANGFGLPVAEKSALKREFDALSDAAKAVYRQARDMHGAHVDMLKGAVRQRIDRSGADEEARKNALLALEKAFDQTLTGGPYFPLARFGDYILIADKKNPTGSEDDRVVLTFENTRARDLMAGKMRMDGYKVTSTTAKQYSRTVNGDAGALVKDLAVAIKGLDMGNLELGSDGKNLGDLEGQLLDTLNQAYIQTLSPLSARKHFTHRKGTPGFSRDAMRAFADTTLHMGNHIARMEHADLLAMQLEGLQGRIDKIEGEDKTALQQVQNEMVKRHDVAMNHVTHPFAAMLGQVGFVMSLGASVASGVVNLTQTPLVTMPYLAAKFGAHAPLVLAKAAKDYLASPWSAASGPNAANNDKLAADERAMLAALEKRGVINTTMAMDLAGAAGADNLRQFSQYGSAWQRTVKMLGWTFHVPEVANRQVTALATYRMAKSKGLSADAAEAAAEEAIHKTHFDYSTSNRARYMEGNFMRVLTMFKQYGQNIAFLYGRAGYEAFRGASKAEKAEARRLLMGLLTTQFAAAGALGLPFVGTLAALATALANGFGEDDEEKDWEVEFRKWAADTFGKEFGEAVSHGAPRLALGWDIAGRIGQNDLFIRAPKREQEGRDAYHAWVQALAGPVAGYALNGYLGGADIIKGTKDLDGGKFMRGVETMVPAFIKNPLKAARYEAEDGLRTRDGQKQIDLTAFDKAGQALGFTPTRVAEMYDGLNAVKNAEHRITERRKELIQMRVRALQERDSEKAGEALDEIKAFNARNPTMAIKGDTILRSLQNRGKREQGTKDGIYLQKNREFLRAEGAFANVN